MHLFEQAAIRFLAWTDLRSSIAAAAGWRAASSFYLASQSPAERGDVTQMGAASRNRSTLRRKVSAFARPEPELDLESIGAAAATALIGIELER